MTWLLSSKPIPVLGARVTTCSTLTLSLALELRLGEPESEARMVSSYSSYSSVVRSPISVTSPPGLTLKYSPALSLLSSVTRLKLTPASLSSSVASNLVST